MIDFQETGYRYEIFPDCDENEKCQEDSLNTVNIKYDFKTSEALIKNKTWLWFFNFQIIAEKELIAKISLTDQDYVNLYFIDSQKEVILAILMVNSKLDKSLYLLNQCIHELNERCIIHDKVTNKDLKIYESDLNENQAFYLKSTSIFSEFSFSQLKLKPLPVPNFITGLSATILSMCEIIDIPCFIYLDVIQFGYKSKFNAYSVIKLLDFINSAYSLNKNSLVYEELNEFIQKNKNKPSFSLLYS